MGVLRKVLERAMRITLMCSFARFESWDSNAWPTRPGPRSQQKNLNSTDR